MARKKRLVDKELIKRVAGKCQLCPEDRYVVLDVHRIRPGADGGEYTPDNTVVLCARCHRLLNEDGWFEIDRWYASTAGRVLRVLVGPNKEEKFF